MELKELEKISKALGDINRLKILMDMAASDGSIQCARIMTLMDLAQPSVSHHIKTLTEAGLIEVEKDGRNYTYVLNRDLLKDFSKELEALATK
ncbi:MAG: metalloregulator ArsR/SmtB family transcription factor [Ferruginibacter sp.]